MKFKGSWGLGTDYDAGVNTLLAELADMESKGSKLDVSELEPFIVRLVRYTAYAGVNGEPAEEAFIWLCTGKDNSTVQQSCRLVPFVRKEVLRQMVDKYKQRTINYDYS